MHVNGNAETGRRFMKVKKLIELLQGCNPEAFVAIRLPQVNREYVERLTDTPACLLYFYVEQRNSCSYSEYAFLPATEEVVIYASVNQKFVQTDDAEMLKGIEDHTVQPDFHSEAN